MKNEVMGAERDDGTGADVMKCRFNGSGELMMG